MGADRVCPRIAFVAVSAVLVACGANSPPAAESLPENGADASASPDASPGVSASPTPHPFAGERDWIAYQTNRDGAEGIWLIHPDGTEDHEIGLQVPGEHLHPDWSPDGTQLVFTSRTETDTLYVLDLETSDARPLWACAGSCLGDDEAAWSPDGSQVAFVRVMEPFDDGISSCALMMGDPTSGAVQQIGPTRSCNDREAFPRWSDDGSAVVYHRAILRGDTVVASAVYTFDLATAEETKLTDDALFGGDADWAGERWIVFSTYPLRDFPCCEVSNLYRIRPDGTDLEQLTHFETGEERATQPRVTPDGASILYAAVIGDHRVPALIPIYGGETVNIVQEGIYTHPVRQPGLCPDAAGCGTFP